jgi:hypothetical protein
MSRSASRRRRAGYGCFVKLRLECGAENLECQVSHQRTNPVGATISISFTFCVPCFRNIGMFLEHGTRSHPHSLNIFVARSS